MEKWDSIIIPSHAQLLFCPPSLALSLLGEIREEGQCGKEGSLQNGWWAMWSHSAIQRLVADCRAGNERSHEKLSQVWDLLALQASLLSHLSHWVITITHLWSRHSFSDRQLLKTTSFVLFASCSHSLVYSLTWQSVRTLCRPAYYNIWGWLFLVTTI